MHFYNEKMFLLMPILIVLIVFVIISFKQKNKALAKFGNIELIKKLIKNMSLTKQRLKIALIIISMFFLIFALSRPQYGAKERRLKRKGVDIVIAIDTSTSMLAEDVKPNRLGKAKQELMGLIKRLQGDRIGIVTFAGVAFVQCPLTLDYAMAEKILDSVDVDSVPVQGTAIGEAIRIATKSFNQQERKYKVLVLLTDGEDHNTDPEGAAKEAAKQGILIYSIGIGSERGEPVPLYDGKGTRIGFKEDKKGEKVLSKLDVETLRKIALATGGKSYIATGGSSLELDSLYNEISQLEKKELESRIHTIYEERFQWFLVPALILLIIECFLTDRRKIRKEWSGRFE